MAERFTETMLGYLSNPPEYSIILTLGELLGVTDKDIETVDEIAWKKYRYLLFYEEAGDETGVTIVTKEERSAYTEQFLESVPGYIEKVRQTGQLHTLRFNCSMAEQLFLMRRTLDLLPSELELTSDACIRKI
jgi:hypothetical protein